MTIPNPRRRALLLGVPRQESQYITSLRVVENDLERVAAALRSSRYEVDLIGLADKSDFTANSLRRRIRKFCQDPDSQGATLLVYFTGHGIHWRGRNWLVAGDAHPDDLVELQAGLLEADQSEVFDKCQAQTIVFMIDACREGVDYPEKGLVLESWTEDRLHAAANQRRATIYSCGLGQLSRFHMPDDGSPGYSMFSYALAEAMHADHPARSLRDVVKALEEGVLRLCRQHAYDRQDIRVSTEGAERDPIWSESISDSPAAGAVASAANPWVLAVSESQLWKSMDDALARPFRAAATRAVGECALQGEALARAAPDGWGDAQWPMRVLKLVEFLVKRTDPPLVLSPAETWLLVAAPFVAQAVRDAAVIALADCSDPPSNEVERIHNAMPQLARKAKRLRETGSATQAESVEAWLLRRAARVSSRSWTFSDDASPTQRPCAPGEVGLLPAALWTGVAPDEPLLEMAPADWRSRLFALARLVDADAGWRDREDLPTFLRVDETLAPGSVDEQPLRGSLLGWLLALSSRMAFDVMTLGEVVIDHIGLSDPVTPAQAVAHCQRLRWLPHGDGRSAELECEHPALDMALRDAIAQADVLLARLHLRRAQGQDGLACASPWPRALHDQGVQPARRDGRQMYQTPHVSFQLAHQEVRELLMGQQLYGDPTLAIRELYQNALDACRYRRARLQYLQRTGRPAADNWRGSISFKQYRDERGRPVLECLDNGIGMGRRELEKAFAAVGKRFADMPEFIDEKAAWQRLDPPIPLYPNSRFGIGVLSYFMLADELELFTRRVALDGELQGPTLHVTVSGSGSLFRIREADDPLVRAGGTLVRLYMNRGTWTDNERSWAGEQEISCTRTLLALLYRSEFDVTSMHTGSDPAAWKAGELLTRAGTSSPSYENAVPDETWVIGWAGAPIWWHPGKTYANQGLVLCDGIATETKLFGCTIDLRDANRPRLTVDRRKVIDLDKALVSTLCTSGAAALTPPPPWLDMNWLWQLAESEPAAAQSLAANLARHQHAVPLSTEGTALAPMIELAKVGLIAADGLIHAALTALAVESDSAGRELQAMEGSLPGWLLPWRIAMWRDLGMPFAHDPRLPELPTGPVLPFELREADIAMLRRKTDYAFQREWRSAITLQHVVASAAILGSSVSEIHARFASWAEMGLSVVALDPSLASSTPERDVGDLLDALEATNAANYEFQTPTLDARGLAIISSRLGITLGRAYEALRPYEPVLDIELGPLPSDAAALSFDSIDCKILSSDVDGRAPWLLGSYSTERVFKITTRSGLSTREVVRRLERMSPLGIAAPAFGGPALDAPPWTPILKYMPMEGVLFDLFALFDAAIGLSMPIGETLAAATRWGWQPNEEARQVAQRGPDIAPNPLLQALLALETTLASRATTCAELAAAWLEPGSLRLALAIRKTPGPASEHQARVEAIACLLGQAAPTLACDSLLDTDKVPDNMLEALAYCIQDDLVAGSAEVPAWKIPVIAGEYGRSLAQIDADVRAVLEPWGSRVAALPDLSPEFLREARTFVPAGLWVWGTGNNDCVAYDPRLSAERIFEIALNEKTDIERVWAEAAVWQPFGVVLPEVELSDSLER